MQTLKNLDSSTRIHIQHQLAQLPTKNSRRIKLHERFALIMQIIHKRVRYGTQIQGRREGLTVGAKTPPQSRGAKKKSFDFNEFLFLHTNQTISRGEFLKKKMMKKT